MDTVHLEPCPNCGGEPRVIARTTWENLLKWCIGCSDCDTHGTLYEFYTSDEDEANLILAAEEWNAMSKGRGEESR